MNIKIKLIEIFALHKTPGISIEDIALTAIFEFDQIINMPYIMYPSDRQAVNELAIENYVIEFTDAYQLLTQEGIHLVNHIASIIRGGIGCCNENYESLSIQIIYQIGTKTENRKNIDRVVKNNPHDIFMFKCLDENSRNLNNLRKINVLQ